MHKQSFLAAAAAFVSMPAGVPVDGVAFSPSPRKPPAPVARDAFDAVAPTTKSWRKLKRAANRGWIPPASEVDRTKYLNAHGTAKAART